MSIRTVDAPRARRAGAARGVLLGVAVDSQANVYVLDGQQSRLLAFGPDGDVLWTAGREGEGPGEFKDARGLALSSSGTLAVTNLRRTRLDLWRTSGEFIDSLALNHPLDLFDAEGRFLYSLVEDGAFTPSIGRPQLVGADGRLYTISDDPFPQIRRYRVQIEER